MGRPMTGTVNTRPISAGVAARRPVTAVDFGETAAKMSSSVRSRAATVESYKEEEEGNWFADHHEASVCLVVGSDESEEDEEEDEGRTKTSEDTLRDMVKTANEYFARSNTGDGGNWWE